MISATYRFRILSVLGPFRVKTPDPWNFKFPNSLFWPKIVEISQNRAIFGQFLAEKSKKNSKNHNCEEKPRLGVELHTLRDRLRIYSAHLVRRNSEEVKNKIFNFS